MKKILKLRIKKEKKEPKEEIKPEPTKGKYQNIGGYLFDPPAKCPKRKISKDGAYWTDAALCFYCEKKCGRYKKFIKMKPERRMEWLRSKGVRIHINVKDK